MRDNDRMNDTVPTHRVQPQGEDRTSPPAYTWILGGIALLLMLALCGLWSLYLLRGQMSAGGPTPTPIIWTPTPVPTSTPLPTATDEPTPTTSPDIAIGRYVQVTGTGGYGLSLRDGPGESYTRVDVALEGKIFIIVDGPTLSGGSEWWKIRDPDNEQREWWAIGNFLEPVEHP